MTERRDIIGSYPSGHAMKRPPSQALTASLAEVIGESREILRTDLQYDPTAPLSLQLLMTALDEREQISIIVLLIGISLIVPSQWSLSEIDHRTVYVIDESGDQIYISFRDIIAAFQDVFDSDMGSNNLAENVHLLLFALIGTILPNTDNRFMTLDVHIGAYVSCIQTLLGSMDTAIKKVNGLLQAHKQQLADARAQLLEVLLAKPVASSEEQAQQQSQPLQQKKAA